MTVPLLLLLLLLPLLLLLLLMLLHCLILNKSIHTFFACALCSLALPPSQLRCTTACSSHFKAISQCYHLTKKQLIFNYTH